MRYSRLHAPIQVFVGARRAAPDFSTHAAFGIITYVGEGLSPSRKRLLNDPHDRILMRLSDDQPCPATQSGAARTHAAGGTQSGGAGAANRAWLPGSAGRVHRD